MELLEGKQGGRARKADSLVAVPVRGVEGDGRVNSVREGWCGWGVGTKHHHEMIIAAGGVAKAAVSQCRVRCASW